MGDIEEKEIVDDKRQKKNTEMFIDKLFNSEEKKLIKDKYPETYEVLKKSIGFNGPETKK